MENKILNYPIIIQAQRYKNFHMSGKRPHLLRKLDKCGLFIQLIMNNLSSNNKQNLNLHMSLIGSHKQFNAIHWSEQRFH